MLQEDALHHVEIFGDSGQDRSFGRPCCADKEKKLLWTVLVILLPVISLVACLVIGPRKA